ncbi:protein phosphatase 2C domain-containing protein [Aetokthonos hydrillicola Thurmond2011]|jgi:protein phosphatase|uniref:Protein phosphatase 2C domain-containing protein n=1 Tax=Aetokthonos hydrillicola Thurmond2011 TaxID=2712845 RepID=A0AAP5IBD2_9CYAN|nr:4-Cys prefix domain-containing protein [Aetokthonos hydrillicola]MBO3459202.1 serine/threonine-protein phosphatase [Aetokthonos hydrillicola CCALA 1050]MBW4584161.1 protein phosphatase 2C domain-containing protein [Aetokthonos hydrillicola CCALA 1050]MDR9898306.1 protein phosphatase 2C domain-containing protein [Aetokthonos hydrillicola Thurmond2011]
MISTHRVIYCTNPECTKAINPIENRFCANCQTPLIRRYLWAVSQRQVNLKPRAKVAQRYEVIRHPIWLDTQPGLLPDIRDELPQEILPYLQLYQQRSHLPQVYGFHDDILLLENVPIDEKGNLYPAIANAWEQATALRQVYWLWQILQLWIPLSELGVAGSLLVAENLRVQGWCVRLLELIPTLHAPSLQQLAECWQPWIITAKTPLEQELKKILQKMFAENPHLEEIANQLNALLLSCAAELPLTVKVAGATDTGPQLTQNEDNCYPTSSDDQDDPVLTHVSMVCDGIGGHEGGEVASQLAVQSLKLQIQALITEVASSNELVSPELLQQQIEASLRVVNNVICHCNDEQKREGRERMGTTVVLSVQIPQRIQTISGKQSENAHELFLVNIGDSRAYWITRNHCQLLTVDDDVVAREVRFARSLYLTALNRPDACALTQALGTKEGQFLRPMIQRFILDEDGILLLCSDGLSDNNLVEQYWRDYSVPVLTGQLSLEEAVRYWINLANQKNGHDNTSVVLTHYRVSPKEIIPITPTFPLVEVQQAPQPLATESSDLHLLNLNLTEPVVTTTATPIPEKSKVRQKQWFLLGGFLILTIGSLALGFFARKLANPNICKQLPQQVQTLCPSVDNK